MNREGTLYTSEVYNVVRASLFALPSLIILITLVMIFARSIHSEAFAVIGCVLACSMPFIFKKSYKRLFTRRVDIKFDDQCFMMTEYTIESNLLVKELIITWAEILSYKCSFSASDTFYLVIFLRDGSTKRLSFKEEKNQEQALSERSVFSIFHYYVKQYNRNKQLKGEITLKPSFLTTKPGAFVLYGITLLAIAGILIHFALAPNTFGLSFMSFFIVIGLFAKRKTDLTLNKKIGLLDLNPQLINLL
jgi:hypothetical protein